MTGWLRPIAPIYRHELTYSQALHLLRFQWGGCAFSILLLLVSTLVAAGTRVLLLVLALPLLVFTLRVWVMLSAADVIAREVEAQTWDSLRVLPWSTRRIVLTKYIAVIVRARGLLYQCLVLGFALRFLVALGYVPPDIEIGAFLLLSMVMFAEQWLDYLLDAALGVAASAFTQSVRRALMLALVLGAGVMIGQLALSIVLLEATTSAHDLLRLFLLLFGARILLLPGVLALTARRAEAI